MVNSTLICWQAALKLCSSRPRDPEGSADAALHVPPDIPSRVVHAVANRLTQISQAAHEVRDLALVPSVSSNSPVVVQNQAVIRLK